MSERLRRLKAFFLLFGHGKAALFLVLLAAALSGGTQLGIHLFGGPHAHRGGAPFRPPAQTGPRRPFTVRGTGIGRLYPGGPLVHVDLVLTNPNATPITITSVTTTVTRTSTAACDRANFVVVRQLAARPRLPAGRRVTLSALGVPPSSWPQLRMLDSGNQDSCEGASVYLAFSGTARG